MIFIEFLHRDRIMEHQDEITFEMVTTKKGDKGTTSLYDGTRAKKNAEIFHFLGTMDTFTSFLGFAKAKISSGNLQKSQDISKFIEDVQKLIIILNGMAASPNIRKPPKAITQEDVVFLEKFEKNLMIEVKLKPEFILQGKSEISSIVDIARTYCRESERRIVGLIFNEDRADLQLPQKFLNRLADVLYIIARYIDSLI